MATTASLESVRLAPRTQASSWQSARTLLIWSTLPLGLFGLLHMGAEQLGVLPLFFAPFGLPIWVGAALHLAQLGLIGAAYWAVTQHRPQSRARFWISGLAAAYMILPFVTPMLDSMQLAMVCTAVTLLAASTTIRAGKATPLAGWLLAPTFAVVGLSAAMGLAVAAYAPPFALMQSNQAPAAA